VASNGHPYSDPESYSGSSVGFDLNGSLSRSGAQLTLAQGREGGLAPALLFNETQD